jgi:hypothetical protein
VQRLRESGVSWERLYALGLEYRYIGLHLSGELPYDEMVRTLKTRIGQFAKGRRPGSGAWSAAAFRSAGSTGTTTMRCGTW